MNFKNISQLELCSRLCWASCRTLASRAVCARFLNYSALFASRSRRRFVEVVEVGVQKRPAETPEHLHAPSSSSSSSAVAVVVCGCRCTTYAIVILEMLSDLSNILAIGAAAAAAAAHATHLRPPHIHFSSQCTHTHTDNAATGVVLTTPNA